MFFIQGRGLVYIPAPPSGAELYASSLKCACTLKTVNHKLFK